MEKRGSSGGDDNHNVLRSSTAHVHGAVPIFSVSSVGKQVSRERRRDSRHQHINALLIKVS